MEQTFCAGHVLLNMICFSWNEFINTLLCVACLYQVIILSIFSFDAMYDGEDTILRKIREYYNHIVNGVSTLKHFKNVQVHASAKPNQPIPASSNTF